MCIRDRPEADAPDGLDAVPGAGLAQLAAQVADVYLERALSAVRRVPGDALEDCLLYTSRVLPLQSRECHTPGVELRWYHAVYYCALRLTLRGAFSCPEKEETLMRELPKVYDPKQVELSLIHI